jgi:hypothetical protein
MTYLNLIQEMIMYLEMCSSYWENCGLKTLTKLMNTIYETGEWPKDFTEVTMIALKKKTNATKCSGHSTISLIAHTAKIIAKILKRRIERKIKDIQGGSNMTGTNCDLFTHN